MIDSTVLFQEAISRDSRSFHARFLTGSQVIDGDIRKVTIRKGSCGSSEFAPGAVFCSYIEAVVDNCAVALEGRELQLQIGIMTNTDPENPVYEYLRIGMFRVRKPSTSRHRTTFTAHGRIASYMNGLFTPPQTMTLAALASALTSQTGVLVQFASGIDTSLPIRGSLEDMTCREALSVIASVVGGYATETAAGDVIIRPFETVVTASYTQDVMTEVPTFADYDTEITGVEVIVVEPGYDEEGEETEGISYTYGDPVNVEISNPYMTEQAFTAFRSSIVGLTYRSGHVPLALGDPRIEPWDTVQVTTVDEDVFVVPCMEIAIVYDGGVQTTVDAPGLEDETQVEGSVAKAVRTAAAAGSAAANARRAAEQAEADAQAASTAADQATQAAATAQESADSAIESAQEALESAGSASASASQALISAGLANEAANSSLLQLSNVENVIGTVNWITDHGSYVRTEDTTVQDRKIYYILEDGVYTEVTDPNDDDIDDYYELVIDESLANYVASHLVLTDEGLFVLNDGTAYKLLLSATGAQIQDENGIPAVTYGATGTEFSQFKPFYIGNDDAYILFTPATESTDASITIGGTNVNLGGGQTLAQLLQQITNIDSRATQTSEALGETSKEVDKIGSFINVDTSDPTQPVMTIGSEQSAIFLQLMNDMLAFYAKGSDTPVAYIDVDEETQEGVLNITNVIAVKEVRFGNWSWYERANGNLSVKWTGADPTQ